MQAGTATLENSVEVPRESKSRNTTQPSNSTSGYWPEEDKNANSKRSTHPYADCNIIYSSQAMEAAQGSTDR